MILVVEDDADTAELMVMLLDRSGWQSMAVTNAQDALDVLSTVKPDLLILDYMLPDRDGLEVLKTVKGDEFLSDVPVVFYSAHDGTEVRAAAEAHGAAKWVRKGTGIGNLLNAVAAAC